MFNFSRGFTLIELLIVVSLIGLLSSVVLAALNTTRGRGNDAAIKADLVGIRGTAETYYVTNAGYSTAAIGSLPTTGCSTATSLFLDATVVSARAHILAQNPSAATVCVLGGTSGHKATLWAVSATLKSGGSWCVDYTGASRSGTATGGNGVCI